MSDLATRGHFRGEAIPVAIIFEHGRTSGIARMDLDAFVRLVGLDVGALPAPRPLPRRRPTRQLELWSEREPSR